MEENKKVNPEETETKGNDCKLTDEELEKAAGGCVYDVTWKSPDDPSEVIYPIPTID